MSSVDVNDENRGVCPGGKHNSPNDIFALDQPTGRPSILRQTENLPSKTVPKGVKVKKNKKTTFIPFHCIVTRQCSPGQKANANDCLSLFDYDEKLFTFGTI